MGVERIGSSNFFKGVDKNGKPAWRAKNRHKNAGNQSASKEVLEKIAGPLRALANEASLISHYTNDVVVRLSLKIDDILDETKNDMKRSLKHITDIEWAEPDDDNASPEETEKKVLAALEKFASRLPV